MLSNTSVVGSRCDDHRDTKLCCFFYINRIISYACTSNYLEEDDLYEIVDGYHRYLVMKQSQRIYDREKGMLPVTVIEKDISIRMASTIRHTRARGMHNLELMTEIVTELVKSGMSDKWIMRNIGMDKNELLRFKQISGLAELFRDKEFGWSDDWSEED